MTISLLEINMRYEQTEFGVNFIGLEELLKLISLYVQLLIHLEHSINVFIIVYLV